MRDRCKKNILWEMGTANHDWNIVKLVVKRNFKDLPAGNPDVADELLKKFASVTHCRLDREHLKSVPILEFLPYLTNLYLQCNEIEEMSNFSVLPGLRFLTLAENGITKIAGIKNLPRLGFLDLSENRISSLDFKEFPDSLLILNISDNPCTDSATFRDDVIQNLPKLKSLDGQSVNAAVDTSDNESDESSDEDTVENPPFQHNSVAEETLTEKNLYDDLSAQVNNSFQDFVDAMNEREKQLQNDFTEFTSIRPSSARDREMTDKEITALEREVANITILKPIDASKKLTPKPPLRSRSNKPRKRPVSGGANTTKVRIPGARPFRRIVR